MSETVFGAWRRGRANTICDVSGIEVGQAHDDKARTGVTVVAPKTRAVAAADIRGGGPGTRETDLLEPSRLVREIDAVVLAGGSVYGLEAASAVTNWLGARGRGYRLMSLDGVPVSPIVPGAILYDLANGGDKNWGEAPPYAALGRAACEALGARVALGRAGAGYGARAGALKGGVGSASAVSCTGLAIGAIMAVNAFGSAVMPGTDVFWAWPFEIDGEFGGRRPPRDWPGAGLAYPLDTKAGARPGANTTIGVLAVNAALDGGQAKRVAVMAQDGIARALRPAHAPVDGDAIFVIATGEIALPEPAALALTELGSIAADCVARAVARGVYEAERQGG
ncbi:MAG: P1 family peptidase [Parvularculaceae bacterium]